MKINSFYLLSIAFYLISIICSEETTNTATTETVDTNANKRDEIKIEDINESVNNSNVQTVEEKSNKNTETVNENNSITKLGENIKLPEMLVVQPVRRTGSSGAKIGASPCGAILKSDANTLTNVGTKLNAIWEIRTPVPNGNCTVSLSPALEENFVKLRPIINGISSVTNNLVVSADNEYSFSCGRQLGFEFMEFELPIDFACDHCTLQVEWTTTLGNVYSCSDLMILGNKSKFNIIIIN